LSQELMSSAEAARYLGISRQHLARLRADGKLTGVRIGKVWAYPKAELRRYKEELREYHRQRLQELENDEAKLAPDLVTA